MSEWRIRLSFVALFDRPAVADEEAEAEAKYSNGARQCMSCHSEGRDPAAHEVFLTPMGISNAEDRRLLKAVMIVKPVMARVHPTAKNRKMAHVCLLRFPLPREHRLAHKMKFAWPVTAMAI